MLSDMRFGNGEEVADIRAMRVSVGDAGELGPERMEFELCEGAVMGDPYVTGGLVDADKLATWPDAERMAHLDAALRDIREALRTGKTRGCIGAILEAAGY